MMFWTLTWYSRQLWLLIFVMMCMHKYIPMKLFSTNLLAQFSSMDSAWKIFLVKRLKWLITRNLKHHLSVWMEYFGSCALYFDMFPGLIFFYDIFMLHCNFLHNLLFLMRDLGCVDLAVPTYCCIRTLNSLC